jgi:ADP-ribose pyrophosphatase YjhB (NUDIX family)
MYKVFFNDRKLFLTDDFSKNFQVCYGLFYKYRDQEDLEELIEFYERLKRIDTLILFHYDIEELRNSFRSCFKMIDAAGGVVLNKKGEILIIRRRDKWDLPKGKLEKGESYQHAAVREVNEECGIGYPEIVKPLLSTYHTYRLNEKLVLKKTFWFEMKYEGNDTPVPLAEEDITEIRWCRKTDLPEILEDTYGSVKDVFNYFEAI